MSKRIVGISPWSPKDGTADYGMMLEAGIEWVRETLPFPYLSCEGDINPAYAAKLERLKKIKSAGMKIGCVSFGAGGERYIKELGRRSTYRSLPDWLGAFDSDGFYECVYKAGRQIGKDAAGLVELWQISNEMDVVGFRGDMTIEQAGRFLVAQAKGVAEESHGAHIGINPSEYYSENSAYLYDLCYAQNPGLLTYVGLDAYFGTWVPGKVQDFAEAIDILYAKTGMPVFVCEWGYNSSGGEALDTDPENFFTVCDNGHFKFVWRKEHSPEEQADFVTTGVRLLLTYPNCMGFFYYSWGDDGYCWQCGKDWCPGESTWGITDGHNNPKPAYFAMKENVLKYNK